MAIRVVEFSNGALLIIIGKSFVCFSTRICYKLCRKSLLKELHRIKILHIEIIDNAGRKKNTKLLPIEFICTSHNSVPSIFSYNFILYCRYVTYQNTIIMCFIYFQRSVNQAFIRIYLSF